MHYCCFNFFAQICATCAKCIWIWHSGIKSVKKWNFWKLHCLCQRLIWPLEVMRIFSGLGPGQQKRQPEGQISGRAEPRPDPSLHTSMFPCMYYTYLKVSKNLFFLPFLHSQVILESSLMTLSFLYLMRKNKQKM